MWRLCSFLVFALFALPLCAAGFLCPPANPPTYYAGGFAAVAGDYDGDGKPDVIVSNWYGVLSILYGRGDGTLEAPAKLADSIRGTPVITDMNADGRADIVFGRYNRADLFVNETMQVQILYATGSRTYGDPVVIETFRGAYKEHIAIAVADVTGDGRLDIVVTNGTVVTLAGRPNGKFETISSPAFATSSARFAVSDADGDGILDVVLGDPGWTSDMQVLRGDGTGVFERRYTVRANSHSETIAADLNGDQHADIIALTRGRLFEVFTGPLTSDETPVASIATENAPVNAVAADFNGDGTNDVAVIQRGAGISTYTCFVTVYGNDGLGHLTQVSEFPVAPYTNYSWPQGIAAADMNHDGALDLVLSSSNDATAVILGNGNGTFRSGKQLRVKGSQPSSFKEPYFGVFGSIDLDGDGVDEIFGTDGHVGRFTGPNEVTFTKLGGTFLAAGDIHPEPGIEVVAHPPLPSSGLSIFSNRGGTWTEIATYPTNEAVHAAGVLDGRLIFIAGNRMYIITGGSIMPLADFKRSIWSQIIVRDMDRDGHDDVLVLRSGYSSDAILDCNFPKFNGELLLFRGLGDGALAPRPETLFQSGMNDMTAGDFDGDGDLDVVVVRELCSLYLELLLQDAPGQFKRAPLIAVRGVVEVASGDLDEDGIDDLILSTDEGVSVYRGSPAGLQFVGSWMAAGQSLGGAVPVVVVRTQRGKPPVILGGLRQLDVVEFSCPARRRSAGH
jgi:hypothetical protein